jgi:hypothetical protein
MGIDTCRNYSTDPYPRCAKMEKERWI